MKDLDDSQISQLQRTGTVIRTYGNPRCPDPSFDPFGTAPVLANYRAADMAVHDACPTAVPHPPPGTPVPVVG